jgi:hypothetical protein
LQEASRIPVESQGGNQQASRSSSVPNIGGGGGSGENRETRSAAVDLDGDGSEAVGDAGGGGGKGGEANAFRRFEVALVDWLPAVAVPGSIRRDDDGCARSYARPCVRARARLCVCVRAYDYVCVGGRADTRRRERENEREG